MEENSSKQELEKTKEREACCHLKKRKPRSSCDVDNSFLRNLPKTKIHKICTIETKLQNGGRFRTVEDRDRFWERLTKQDQAPLTAHSGSKEKGVQAPLLPSTAYQEDKDTEEKPVVALLALIHEDRESLMSSPASGKRHPGTLPPQRHKSTMSTGLLPKHPQVTAFEQRFKQVEFPKLSAFTLDLEPTKEDAKNLKLRQGYRHRASLRHHASRQLNQMYEMSIANLAAARRMLDKNKELSTALNGSSLSDVLSTFKKESYQNRRRNGAQSVSLHECSPPLETDMNNNDVPESFEESITLKEKKLERDSSRLQQQVLGEESTDDNSSFHSCQFPLSLDAVMENDRVLEAKRPGVYWYNYGKFLPPIANGTDSG